MNVTMAPSAAASARSNSVKASSQTDGTTARQSTQQHEGTSAYAVAHLQLMRPSLSAQGAEGVEGCHATAAFALKLRGAAERRPSRYRPCMQQEILQFGPLNWLRLGQRRAAAAAVQCTMLRGCRAAAAPMQRVHPQLQHSPHTSALCSRKMQTCWGQRPAAATRASRRDGKIVRRASRACKT